jgi:hypothetical protein
LERNTCNKLNFSDLEYIIYKYDEKKKVYNPEFFRDVGYITFHAFKRDSGYSLFYNWNKNRGDILQYSHYMGKISSA